MLGRIQPTVRVKELFGLVPVNPDIWGQAHSLSAPDPGAGRPSVSGHRTMWWLNGMHLPQGFPVVTREHIPETRLKPQTVRKSLVVDLEPVIHPDSIPSLGLARRGGEREFS